METVLHAVPPHLIPLLAIGAFSGIRMAELARLDWTAVDLDRRLREAVRGAESRMIHRRPFRCRRAPAVHIQGVPRAALVCKRAADRSAAASHQCGGTYLWRAGRQGCRAE